MSDEVIHVPKGRRVRFGRQDVQTQQPGEEPWRVVRVIASRRPDLEGSTAMGRVLVAFRMAVRFREVLATLAYCSDLPMGLVVERLLGLPGARLDLELLPPDIGLPRGRPNDIEDAGFNQVVEIQEAGESFSTQLVGHWVDQCVYLSPPSIERLEHIAKAASLTADQALDAVIARHLSLSLTPR
ncbi:MAG: hypothetical protein JNL21_28320 [Myxococcales bacterium]|nr:hypothetical protein [Myxococcales bacterium]